MRPWLRRLRLDTFARSKLYACKDYYDEDVLVKPEVLQQLSRIAALIGPAMSEAVRKQR